MWIGVRGHTDKCDVVGVCYRLPAHEELDKAVFRQLEEVSCSLAQIFMGVFSQPPHYLLEGQHTKAQAIRKVSGVCW